MEIHEHTNGLIPTPGKLFCENTIALQKSEILMGILPSTLQPAIHLRNRTSSVGVTIMDLKDLITWLPTMQAADKLDRSNTINLGQNKKLIIRNEYTIFQTNQKMMTIYLKDVEKLKRKIKYIESAWTKIKTQNCSYKHEYKRLLIRLQNYQEMQFADTIERIQEMLVHFGNTFTLSPKQKEILAKGEEKIIEDLYYIKM